MIEDYL